MKLIDKDALCRCVSDYQMSGAGSDREKVTEYDLLDDVRKAVESAPGVKPSGWIDIRDQKPEVGSEIIGMHAYGGIAAFVVEVDGYRKDCTAEYCKVDYWLPMPELPEEYR